VNPFTATALIQITDVLPPSLAARLTMPTGPDVDPVVARVVAQAQRHNSLHIAPQTVFEIAFYD
jgi:hypothetical protein